jgi:hypothetical protein
MNLIHVSPLHRCKCAEAIYNYPADTGPFCGREDHIREGEVTSVGH